MFKKKTLALGLMCACGALLALNVGCSPENELGGVPIPNALPDTRITGQPPSLLEAGFIVRFFWTGTDPDGKIRGYQWKMSNNGIDGISVQDSITIDPATGDTLNPWHFTTVTDTAFVVSADISGFPGDQDLDAEDQRNYQTHTLFVRSVDEEGGVDPSPAFISFTATTLLPTIIVDKPSTLSDYRDVQAAPPSVTFGWSGNDPDYELGTPVEVRYLWKEALYATDRPPHYNTYLRTRYEFDQHVEELVSFADSAWSNWVPYSAIDDERIITFPNQRMFDDTEEQRQVTYIFAIQARDIAGAVSVDRTYGRNVHNVYVSTGMTPALEIFESQLGRWLATGREGVDGRDIASGQDLEFSWSASAASYAGQVVSYRYGWDVADPDDENDAGWDVQEGLSPLHLRAPIRSFPSGNHTLTIQAKDNSDQLTRFTILLSVVPVPDRDDQFPVLLIDDVIDRDSQAWPAQDGITPLDNDRYRDNFWQITLAGQGGVAGFEPTRDIIDIEAQQLTYRRAVNYKVVLWTTRYAVANYIWNEFKPLQSGESQFIWLSSYQDKVGNLFLVGDRVLNEFIEERRWMLPIIFDTNEEELECGGTTYDVGFGEEDLPNGTTVLRGRERYPWESLGVSVIDHITPRYNVYNACGVGSTSDQARGKACVGVKGMILDPAFKANYMSGSSVFTDTIFTEPTIDWKDLATAYVDSLRPYAWGSDEFYDANITVRATPWAPRFCEGAPCIDPMFRIYSRYDWVQDNHIANGDNAWPMPGFSSDDITRICGRHALDPVSRRMRTTGKTMGFVSHTLEANKPYQVGDVVWGFDPYRFNHQEIRKAIHWVLGRHFDLTMD